MMFFRRFSIVLFTSVLFLSACRKSTSANWDVDAGIPVVNSVLNIRNFIADTLFMTDNNGVLHLRIKREVASLKLDSLVSLPDTTFSAPFKNPIPFDNILQPGAPINTPASDIKFNLPDGVALSTIIVREGQLYAAFSNDLSQPLDIVYELPTVSKNGIKFQIKETIPPGVNSLKRTYDLSGYTFNLNGSSGKQYNTLAQTCTLNLSPTASTVVLKYNQGANVSIGYSKVIPQFVEGYFGQQEVIIAADTADFNFLDNFTAANFMLSEATMDFSLVNEFGVDFSGSISNVRAIHTRQNKSVSLQTTQLASINLDRATRQGDLLSSKTKLLKFNTGNSNITAFISNLPDKLSYEGKVKMNPVPPGNISGYHDFAFYNTGLRILADIDIPLRFAADYFELITESDFTFDGNKSLDALNSGAFVVYATNGFPFAAQLQAYMYDASKNLIDSVFISGQNRIEGGQLNAANVVITPSRSTLRVPVDKIKLENLQRCKKMKIVSRLLMPKSPPDISILEKYEIGLNITAEANYNVELSR